MRALEELCWRRGKLDMAQWFVDQLIGFVKASPEIIDTTPVAIRAFLSDMMLEAVRKAKETQGAKETNGTRPLESSQVCA